MHVYDVTVHSGHLQWPVRPVPSLAGPPVRFWNIGEVFSSPDWSSWPRRCGCNSNGRFPLVQFHNVVRFTSS